LPGDNAPPAWFIRCQKEVPKSHYGDPGDHTLDNAESVFEKFTTCLHVMHSGIFYFGPLFTDGVSPFKKISDGYSTWSPPLFTGVPSYYSQQENKYILEKKDVNNLRQLYIKFSKLNNADLEFITLPISRFNYAFYRLSPHDKIIDHCIALESIYIRDNSELSYKLALRCSHFLSSTSTERMSMFKTLRETYNLRSQIVHGNNWKDLEINEAMETEELVRQSIKKLLDKPALIHKVMGKQPKKEIHFLDQLILGMVKDER